MILNVPMIDVWVKLLQVPFRYLFPSVMFFIAVGVFSTQSSLFQISKVLAFGLIGALLMYLEFSGGVNPARFCAGADGRGKLPPGIAAVAWQHGGFVERPISCTFVVISALLAVTVTCSAWRSHGGSKVPAVEVPDAGLAVKE